MIARTEEDGHVCIYNDVDAWEEPTMPSVAPLFRAPAAAPMPVVGQYDTLLWIAVLVGMFLAALVTK